MSYIKKVMRKMNDNEAKNLVGAIAMAFGAGLAFKCIMYAAATYFLPPSKPIPTSESITIKTTYISNYIQSKK